MSSKTPFDLLKDFEVRSLRHAAGLPEQTLAEGAWSGICFRIAGMNLATRIGDVVEILTMPDVTNIPGSKAWLMGVSNVRGNLIPIIDTQLFFSGQRSQITKVSRVLVVPQDTGTVGLLIDEVQGQRHFGRDDERQGDPIDHPVSKFLAGEFEKDGTRWNLLQVSDLVVSPEFLQAAA